MTASKASPTTSGDSGPLLRGGPSPHWTGSLNRRHLNLALLIGLAPAVIAAFWTFGWAAAGRIGLAGGAAVLVELLTQRAMKQPERIGDLSALVQGVLLALLLPPGVAWWLLLVGVAVMIVVGKQLFGGVGGYPLNPVLVAWAAMLLSWGNRIHPIGDPGLLGTAWVPAILIGGGVLTVLGHIKWQAPLGMIVGCVAAATGLGLLFPESQTLAEQLSTGSFMLGAFFLATDTTTAPANPLARVIFGLGAGLLVVVLRLWGTWPEPVPFALLLMNLLAPLLDRIRFKPIARVTSHA